MTVLTQTPHVFTKIIIVLILLLLFVLLSLFSLLSRFETEWTIYFIPQLFLELTRKLQTPSCLALSTQVV